MIDPKRLRVRMVQEQIEKRGVSDPEVLRAMSEVPRHLFVEEALAFKAYSDNPLPIGEGQTISQPYIVARMTELLKVKPGMKVLEIGTGSGYQAAVLANLGASVYSVERIRKLLTVARERFAELNLSKFIKTRQDDGTMGWPLAAPFDRIIVTAGGPEVPAPLVDQLAEGGRLVIPVGDQRRTQRLVLVTKINGEKTEEDMGSVAFVDLVGKHGWD